MLLEMHMLLLLLLLLRLGAVMYRGFARVVGCRDKRFEMGNKMKRKSNSNFEG